MRKILIVAVIIMLILISTTVSADSIFDINFDGIVDAQDASIVWFSIQNGEQNMDYDVNSDGVTDSQDCALIWSHIGDTNGDGDTILDWLSKLIWGP